ncbi:Fumarate hydratase [Psidium guajava]|nr:Fumarate hydratase [Psidium guajava]
MYKSQAPNYVARHGIKHLPHSSSISLPYYTDFFSFHMKNLI